jgi:hypothetical protein
VPPASLADMSSVANRCRVRRRPPDAKGSHALSIMEPCSFIVGRALFLDLRKVLRLLRRYVQHNAVTLTLQLKLRGC